VRRTIADWTSGVLAVAILALGAVVVIKPAVDHWGDLYRANPFEGPTTERVVTRTSGEQVQRTTTVRQESRSFTERVLGDSGMLFLRIALVALAALLAAIVVQRVILGEFPVRAGPAKASAPAVAAAPAPRAVRTTENTGAAAAASTSNGHDSAPPEPSGANLAPAIAKLVSSRREELGLSQRELAKRAGISHTVVSRIESGEHSPSRKTLERLADALLVGE
jgi:HTH-type transcriptional regulator/antitoxin HipB